MTPCSSQDVNQGPDNLRSRMGRRDWCCRFSFNAARPMYARWFCRSLPTYDR